MRYPASEQVSSHESSFEAAHSEARKKEFTGTLVLDAVDGEGVAVYLDGWLVYAKFRGATEEWGQEALEAMKDRSGEIERHASRRDPVEMFRTYMSYIGREEGLVSVHHTDKIEVPKRTILVTQGGNLEKTEVPPGTRIGYSPDERLTRNFLEENGMSGYALSNDELVFFEDGEETERKRFKDDELSILVRMESEEAGAALECDYLDVYTQGSSGGQVDVEFDIEGWEIVESTGGGGSGGLLSGILGG
ncbi:MAG: hypothetical protein ACLFSW_03180 [Halobacteriales archaeon]